MRRSILSALTAILLTAAACGDGGDPTTTSAAVATSVTTTTVAPTTAAAASATTTTAASTTTTPSATSSTAPPARDPAFDNWTVILASLPVEEFSEADARSRLAEFGVPDGGVLLSTDYPSLNPGYWVVYSGVFDRDWKAVEHCGFLPYECYHRYLGASAETAPTLANGQALVWILGDFNLDLAVVSLETGEVVRTVVESRGEGEFPGPPRIGPNGRAAFLDIGFEDSWFACDPTLGDVYRVDLETGRLDDLLMGIDPIVSPDGRYLAWTEAPECREDPDEPMFFVAFHETIVVRDLETGDEKRWRPSGAIAGTDAARIWGKGWSADSQRIYFQMPAGMRELRVDGPTDIATDDHQLIPLFGYAGIEFLYPIGQLQSGELAVVWSDTEPEFESGVDLYDPAAGERTTLVQGDSFFPAAVDGSAGSLAWAEVSRLRSVGAVEIDVDLGREIYGIGW